jgi:transposase-like protein
MTSKTTNKYSPEVRERAVRMVLDSEPLRRHVFETNGERAA